MNKSHSQAEIGARLGKISNDIRIATAKSGRDPDSVRLVVVTKGHPVEAVQAAISAGAMNLGENYVQEASQKINSVEAADQVVWHMIGHIQSRKAAQVVDYFPWIHSVDSLKLARRLDRFAGAVDLKPRILLEYNVSGEATKFGWDATDPTSWPDLIPDVEAILSLESIQLTGLMTMAPYLPNPEEARPFFQKLRQLAEYFQNVFGAEYFSELSMGMSQDYQIAIEEGSTFVRIGTAIMGPRP